MHASQILLASRVPALSDPSRRRTLINPSISVADSSDATWIRPARRKQWRQAPVLVSTAPPALTIRRRSDLLDEPAEGRSAGLSSWGARKSESHSFPSQSHETEQEECWSKVAPADHSRRRGCASWRLRGSSLGRCRVGVCVWSGGTRGVDEGTERRRERLNRGSVIVPPDFASHPQSQKLGRHRRSPAFYPRFQPLSWLS